MVSHRICHFILTRFNLLLWTKDKEGNKVRTKRWLEHRFRLFEECCLPSIANQTCKNFEWIVLFDSSTPERYKERIKELQAKCPQLVSVFVEPEKGRYFAQIFLEEVKRRMDDGRGGCQRVLTTYLDNDDALNIHFVEDLQRRAADLSDGTFVYYRDGYQLFTDHHYLMQIRYLRNHFASVVEAGNPATLKTIYGYGSHYYIDQIKGAKIEFVKDMPMWCEVIHEKNMGNDAYFLKAKMVRDAEILQREFALDETIKASVGLYLFRFLPRYLKTFVRRIIIRIRGYRFE